MKKTLAIMAWMLLTVLAIQAQVVVSGVVKDRETGQTLNRVSISAEGFKVHTVSNEDGRFVLKLPTLPKYILLSHIGYKTRQQSLSEGKTEELKILMAPNTVELNEIFVSIDDPQAILRAAMRHIDKNYPNEPELMRCFYRETAQRGSRYISIAEAVTDMYKTAYGEDISRDAVVIQKGRRLMSMKSKDTLGVKIQGGPVLPLVVDVAKNSSYLLNEQALAYCTLHLGVPEKIDDRMHHVLLVEPKAVTPYPLMGGRLYIDQQTLTISRAELQLDIRDWRTAAEYMLVSKPLGLKFKPKELTVVVAYNTDYQGVTRMSYVRNEMRFNCDWKRRLFQHTFTTVSEMVVTDRLQHGKEARRPKGRSSFGIRERFYDKVEYFEDADFWADYNIIEPSESLEHAINKLKKKAKD